MSHPTKKGVTIIRRLLRVNRFEKHFQREQGEEPPFLSPTAAAYMSAWHRELEAFLTRIDRQVHDDADS